MHETELFIYITDECRKEREKKKKQSKREKHKALFYYPLWTLNMRKVKQLVQNRLAA